MELGARVDHQKVKADSDKKDYSGTGVSASAAANWQFAPNYKLSLTGSHQQRLPVAQELYADGLHFATNTYEVGNPDLDKETSNNLELETASPTPIFKTIFSTFGACMLEE